MHPSKPYLSLALARFISNEVTNNAQTRGLRVIVVIVDEGGHIVLQERMDNAAYGQIDEATARARRAISFQEKLTSAVWKGAACIEAHGIAIGAISITAAGANTNAFKSNAADEVLAQLMADVLEKSGVWLNQRLAA